MVSLSDGFRADLKFMREKKRLTHAQMADKLCISTSTYGKLERGEISWTLEKVQTAVQIVFNQQAKIIFI